MKTNKKNQIESGKAVFEAAKVDPNAKGTKEHPSVTANNQPDNVPSFDESLYSALQGAEQDTPKSTISYKELSKMNDNGKTLTDVLKAHDDEVNQANETNKENLIQAFKTWYLSQMDGYDFDTWRAKFWRKFRNTKGFTITFQIDEDTKGVTEVKHTWTAANLKISYNSTKNIARMKRAELTPAAAREALRKAGTPEIVLATMTDAVVISLAAKL